MPTPFAGVGDVFASDGYGLGVMTMMLNGAQRNNSRATSGGRVTQPCEPGRPL